MASKNNSVDLYYDNVKKFETSVKGIQVGTGVTIETNGQATYTGIVTATSFSGAIELSSDTSPQLGGNLDCNNFYLQLDDNRSVVLGTNTDAQLYHSGTHCYLLNTTGSIYLMPKSGEYSIACYPDSSVELYFNNSKKIESTNTGAIITGIVTATGRVGVGTNTTTERNALTGLKAGHLIMNATTNLLEYYNGTAWTPIDTPPTVTSVNNTNITETQIAAGFDLVITGSAFKSGATVTFVGNDGTEHISPTTTVNTTTQITARVHGSVSNANEPYDVKVSNSSGLSGILEDAFNINAKPVWTTASGTLATILDGATGTHATVAATDPEGDTVTYSGTVGGGMSLNSTTGAITGNPTDVNSNTTVSFTLNATSSGSNVTARNFNIIVQPGPVTDNLEVWFDPRNYSSLANNSTASSNSASNTNAIWTLTTDGTAGYVSGTNSQAIEVTSGSRVQFHTKGQDITAFDNINNFTFEFWVYVGSTSTPSWAFLGGKSDFWNPNEAGIYVHNAGDKFGFHTTNTYGVQTTSLPSIGWHHVVAVRNLSDANCRKIYIDNSVVAQDNDGDNDANHTLNNNNALTIGGDCTAQNSNNFNVPSYPLPSTWKFGHTRFYTDALTASEVTKNWNAEKAIYGL